MAVGSRHMKGRPVLFGETLYDCFPDGQSVLGGAPFNVAWHLQALGASPLLFSRVGDDEAGRRIVEVMRAWGMDTTGIQTDPEKPTGVVNITLSGAEPAYDIVANSAWDFIDATQFPKLEGAALLYHGSLASRNSVSRAALQTLIGQSGLPRFVDINLRAPHYDRTSVLELIQGASWLKLNQAEYSEIVSDGASRLNQDDFLKQFDLENLVITRSEDGAELISRSGQSCSIPRVVPEKITDAVGAGDGFSSVLILAHLYGWPLPVALERASEFALAVLGLRGATTNEKDFYQKFYKAWRLTAS
jgi:fructokinase